MELFINYKGKTYPKFQELGFASQFAIPYARHLCKGRGVDVGCNRNEWMLYPRSNSSMSYEDMWNSIMIENKCYPIDPVMGIHNALNFPTFCNNLDYIFSSHCLEHLYDWVDVLDYWTRRLKSGGILFLYLPDFSQEYWKPWNNRKHKNIFNSEIISEYMKDSNYTNVFKSGVDLNNSFMVYGEKK